MPELKPGGLALRLATAKLRRSTARPAVATAGKLRVSAVPIWDAGSPSQPFMDNEHEL